MAGIETFNDDLSEDEEKALRELSEAHPVPTGGTDDDIPAPAAEPTAGEPAAAEPEAKEPAAAKEPGAEPTTDVNADADADAKDDFAAFAEKHKDRSPEELIKLAFQKEQARKSARFDAKEARETITQLRDGLQKRMADRAEQQAKDKAAFKDRLASDPDAAVEEQFDRQQQREREEAEAEEWQAYVATQTEICQRAIPEFQKVAPEMMQFGVERLGYDPLQVQNAHDSRDMIALYMASRFDRLVQAGIVDFSGRVLDPTRVAPATDTATAGRPARQAPRTLSAAPGAAGGGSKSLKDQAQDLLTMSDEDFDRAVEAGSFDQTLRTLAGGSQ